jgi:phenylalanyl-tRNA synthetase beta chain
MKLSYNWLKEFVDFDLTPAQTAELLTFNGIETTVAESGGTWTNVVTAKVVECAKHPQADKLSVCSVSDGTAAYPVVCGAPNVAAGQIVALARLGAELPGGFKIKKAKLRGVESEGMICSASELGISGDSSGIMVLPENTPVGKPLESVLDVSDSTIEIEIPTNRPDCLSHWGVAREIAAKLRKPLKLPDIKQSSASGKIRIDIEDTALCSRYIGCLITGIKVGPSPEWMKKKLERCGLRPINNIVDITNYVLLELGHPLHAFDAAEMKEGRIVVRPAKKGEKILALDGKEYPLAETMLVIADAEKPQAVAGVMGGEHSGVTAKTKDMILESAIFKPQSVRRTSKALGLSSDASYRFERAVSWEGAELAAWRALNLILELAGGKFEARLDKTDTKFNPLTIRLRTSRIARVLGHSYSIDEIRSIIEALGMKASAADDGPRSSEGGFDVTIPSWRHDIQQEIDLIEEVARINGYDRIPVTIPAVIPDINEGKKAAGAESLLVERLVSIGFCEAINTSFLEESKLKELGLSAEERLSNPLSKENEVMRTSLLPGLVKNYFTNAYFGNKGLRLFEIGKIFLKEGEKKTLGILVTPVEGGQDPFYILKGVLLSALAGNKVTVEDNAKPYPYLHPGKSAALKMNGREIGQFGAVVSTENVDITQAALCYAELDVETVEKIWNRKEGSYKALGKFPGVKRDLSLLAGTDRPYGDVSALLQDYLNKNGLLSEFELTDIYRDAAKLGAGKISYTLHLIFSNPERTLTDAEVNKAMEDIVALLKDKLGATLR